MRIVFEVDLPALVKKEGSYYVSICPVLDVCSQGKTKAKARENLIEAVQLFIESCYERGTLDKVLHDCGFKPVAVKSGTAERGPVKHQMIRVPLSFDAPLRHKETCHA